VGGLGNEGGSVPIPSRTRAQEKLEGLGGEPPSPPKPPKRAQNPRSVLALRYVASNADQPRYVASRRRWFIRDGASWRPDNWGDVPWRARQACLQVAAESNEPARNLAATITAVERLARRDPGSLSRPKASSAAARS
jgi:hypothetical protein